MRLLHSLFTCKTPGSTPATAVGDSKRRKRWIGFVLQLYFIIPHLCLVRTKKLQKYLCSPVQTHPSTGIQTLQEKLKRRCKWSIPWSRAERSWMEMCEWNEASKHNIFAFTEVGFQPNSVTEGMNGIKAAEVNQFELPMVFRKVFFIYSAAYPGWHHHIQSPMSAHFLEPCKTHGCHNTQNSIYVLNNRHVSDTVITV